MENPLSQENQRCVSAVTYFSSSTLQYLALPETTVGRYAYVYDVGVNGSALSLCQQYYKKGRIDPANDTFNINPFIIRGTLKVNQLSLEFAVRLSCESRGTFCTFIFATTTLNINATNTSYEILTHPLAWTITACYSCLLSLIFIF